MSDIMGLVLGQHVLIVGVEDDPEPGLMRVYINARYLGQYVLVADHDDQERIRKAWDTTTGHVTMPRPSADMVFQSGVDHG